MPRRSRGWKVWVEASGCNQRCRWSGIYGTGQATFVKKADAGDHRDAKKAEFQRRDAGLAPIAPAAAAAPDYAAFRVEHLAWLERQRAAQTLYNAKRSLDLWEEFAGQEFPAASRKKSGKTIDQFCDWLLLHKKRGGEPFHVNHVRLRLRHLKAAFRWGLKREHLDYDPFLHFEMPPPVPVARLMTPEELGKIMLELPDVCRRALIFVVYTGLRIGEVLRLDWSGVRQAPTGIWYLTVLKSKTRRAKPETKTQAVHPRARAVMGPQRAHGRVFDVTLSRLEQTLRAAVVKLGLGRARWHDLRHTWATYLMEDVRDLKALMDLGGWATVQAAMIYQHSTEKRRDASLQMTFQVPSQPLNAESVLDVNAEK